MSCTIDGVHGGGRERERAGEEEEGVSSLASAVDEMKGREGEGEIERERERAFKVDGESPDEKKKGFIN